MFPTRHFAFVLLALTVPLVTACSGVPSTAAVPSHSRPLRTHPIEDFIDSTQLRGAAFSADGRRILFSSNRSGTWNAYSVAVEGGDWTAMTDSKADNSYAVAYFPNDDRVLVTRDQGGNELDHLYVVDADGRERDLTPGDKHLAEFMGFSHDGGHFYVASNERDPAQFDLYRYDSTSYARTQLYENTRGYLFTPPGDDMGMTPVSPDGRWLTLHTVNNANDFDLSVLDLRSGEMIVLSGGAGDARFQAQDFSPDSRWLYYTANDAGEFNALRRFNLATRAHEPMRAEAGDIARSHFSRSGRYRVDTVEREGGTAIRLVDMASGRDIGLPNLPAGEIRGVRFAPSERRLAFYLNGDRQPNDLYALDVGGAPRALTRSLNEAIAPEDLVESGIVRFDSFDGMSIPNVLWKPHQASATARAPALVWVHGGPGGQTTRAHNPVVQFLANHGYVVLGVNNRGSAGYGKSFLAADDGKHGREPLQDVVAAKRYLQSLDYVDPERIGVIGQSYGGYMTVAALAFHPDEFRVGVDLFGVTNWLRTIESIPPHLGYIRKAAELEFGHPLSERDKLMAISPLFHAARINKPLMVLQGANDPRTLKAESDEIVAAVRKNGVPVEYVVFDDEGHGFSRKPNQIEGYGRVLAFLDHYLKGDGSNHAATGAVNDR